MKEFLNKALYDLHSLERLDYKEIKKEQKIKMMK